MQVIHLKVGYHEIILDPEIKYFHHYLESLISRIHKSDKINLMKSGRSQFTLSQEVIISQS